MNFKKFKNHEIKKYDFWKNEKSSKFNIISNFFLKKKVYFINFFSFSHFFSLFYFFHFLTIHSWTSLSTIGSACAECRTFFLWRSSSSSSYISSIKHSVFKLIISKNETYLFKIIRDASKFWCYRVFRILW